MLMFMVVVTSLLFCVYIVLSSSFPFIIFLDFVGCNCDIIHIDSMEESSPDSARQISLVSIFCFFFSSIRSVTFVIFSSNFTSSMFLSITGASPSFSSSSSVFTITIGLFSIFVVTSSLSFNVTVAKSSFCEFFITSV